MDVTITTMNNAQDEAEDAPEIATPWIDRAIALGGFCVAAAVLLHPTFFTMTKTWMTSSSYIHGLFIAPIAIWMIAAKSRIRLSAGSSLPGVVILLAGAGMWLAGRAASVSLVEQVAFITIMIGGVGVIYGARALRDWAFPLAFLYFMVPFGESLVPYLQVITAKNVVALLSITGAPVTLDGYLIRTPTATFEVAEACSGLRFLIAAIVIAALFSYVHFQTWRKRITFVFFAAGLAIAANALRAFLIIMIATVTEMRLTIGPDHVFIGWLTYALVFLALITIGMKHADKPKNFDPEALNEGQISSVTPRAATAFAIVIAVAAYSVAVIERPVNRAAPASLSLMNAPGWRILPPPENWRASAPAADRTLAATYATDQETVYISIGYFTHDRPNAEIVNYANRAWDGDYWRKSGEVQEVVYIFGESKEAAFTTLAGPEGRRLAAVTAYWLDDQIYFHPWRMKLAQMKAKLKGSNPQGGVIMIAAAYSQHPDEAIKEIRSFTTATEPLQDWLARNEAR